MDDSFVAPTLTSACLRLDPLRLADLPAILRIYADERVTRYFGQDSMSDIDQAGYWLEIQQQTLRMGMGLCWALRARDSDRVLGTICFDGLNREWHNVSLSYALYPDAWGQGFASEALAVAIDWAFAGGFGCPLHRIQALVFSANLPSLRVLEKLGFVYEGRRLGLLYWQQRYWDLDSYCLLNPN